MMVVELTPLTERIHGEASVSAGNIVQPLLTAGGLVPVVGSFAGGGEGVGIVLGRVGDTYDLIPH